MVDTSAVTSTSAAVRMELPSWTFGNSGARSKGFSQPGVPGDPYEKVAGAAQMHRFTGVATTQFGWGA
jgi:L-rhamnose isomerase/sugar isomerase